MLWVVISCDDGDGDDYNKRTNTHPASCNFNKTKYNALSNYIIHPPLLSHSVLVY